jgi:uncharacterized protein (TIGR03435 family)
MHLLCDRLSTIAAMWFVGISVLTVAAQPPAAAPQEHFDVASVKVDNGPFIPRSSGLIGGGPGTNDAGHVTITQMPLRAIITSAYGITADQLDGKLDNADNDKFTIIATMPTATTLEQFHLMLQNLLSERFHLQLHHELRNFPGYDLVVSPGGGKFKEWTPDPNVPPSAGGRPLHPGQSGFEVSATRTPPLVRVTNRQSFADFVKQLSYLVMWSDNMLGDTDRDQGLLQFAGGHSGSPAPRMPRYQDKTGLSGMYAFTLEFEGTLVPGRAQGAGGPTIFSALEKQAGLKLVKAKSIPADVLVIDYVDKVPTEN